jgi:hypothetical protein
VVTIGVQYRLLCDISGFETAIDYDQRAYGRAKEPETGQATGRSQPDSTVTRLHWTMDGPKPRELIFEEGPGVQTTD